MSRPSLYSFAHLGGIECGIFRLRGVGLANCLFPWARCEVASRKYELTRIASTWPQLCHRQWMRWDRDKRCYVGLFNETGAIRGVRKLLRLATTQYVQESNFLACPDAYRSGVIVFAGIDGYFSSILDEHQFVAETLLATAKRKHTVGLEALRSPAICVHVRFGDFTAASSSNASSSDRPQLHVRQPITWYVHIVRELMKSLGNDIRILVSSDGSDDELRPLLALPQAQRLTFGSSIADLLALSAAQVLVASGSTFSMWAAYLGRMPVIWPRGQQRQRLHGDAWEYETELGFDGLPEKVSTLVRQRFALVS